MKKIILASGSPRRRQLMKQLGLKFKVVLSDYQEDMTLKLKPTELAKHLSSGKALAVAEKYPDSVVIAADTFVALGEQLLGKPGTPQKASKMLKLISGRTLDVITGFTIIDTGTIVSKAVVSKVYIKKLSDTEIKAYVATGEPLDKAGAFGIQEKGALIVKKISGDYNNIVGLPLFELGESLRKIGIVSF